LKKAELVAYLKKMYMGENSGGEWVFYLKDDAEGFLEMMPNLRKVVGQQYVNASLAMRPRWFADLSDQIFNNDTSSYLFTASNGTMKVGAKDMIKINDINELVEMSFAWFYNCLNENVLSSELRQKYEIYDRPGGWQYTHIVACVIKGDVDKLGFYLNSFISGNRVGFIPLIKQEYFENAVKLAKKYKDGEAVPPVEF